MSSSDNDSLCSDCREIDWKDLVDRPLRHEEDSVHPTRRFIKNMEKSHEEMKISKCRSCQILSTIIEKDRQPSLGPGSKLLPPKLRVTSLEHEANLLSSECLHGSVALLTTDGWSNRARRYVALLAPGIDPNISKIPPLIKDFAWMRNAILECRQGHKNCVKVVPPLHGLQVIDCLASSCSISVVSVRDSCHYAALSYVWGGLSTKTTEIPAVVKDAIKVTVELGLRYLWVDQYCIPQNDAQKHRLIRLMDKIYSAAFVTIVAAAGKTSADGLPGVSTVFRMAQMEIKIDEYTLFDLPAALNSVKTSTWASRGWTYQEGLLSTRCLVFTDRGVLYNCRERFVDENLQQLVSSETPASMKEHKIIPTLFATTDTGSRLLCDRIVQYTERHLSYSQDSLNAFLGIFADYEQQQAGLVLPSQPRPEVPSVLSSPFEIAPQQSHIWGLPLQFGARMLEWYHPLPPNQRRSDFPSWSWIGWEGGIGLKTSLWSSRNISTDPTFAPTSIEIPDQLTDYHDRRTKVLYVTGATVELKFATKEQTKRIIQGMKRPPDARYSHNYDFQTSRHHRLIEVSSRVFVAVGFRMSAEPAPQDQTIGLLVTVDAENHFCASSMIVLQRSGQNFTRIGFIDANELWEHKLIDNGYILPARGMLPGEKLLPGDGVLPSQIRSKYKFVDIDGGFVGKKMLPSSFFDGLSFVQEFARQRICLE